MANVLKMAKVHSIQTLHARGWSQRRIARVLGVHRETIARYLRLAESGAHASPDSLNSPDQNRPNPPAGSELCGASGSGSPTTSTAG
jgi:transposase